MKQRHHLNARSGLAVVTAAGAIVAVSLGGSTASAGGDASASGAAPATITMQFKRGRFFFDGASQVRKGDNLRIRNNTNPRMGGPHTFSLVQQSLLPENRREQRQCFEGNICLKIGMAHRFNEDTGRVGRPLVRVGKGGWNRQFSNKSNGDTWYSETDGETFSQRVSASAGRSLYYMCAIHPEMQGQIRVVGRN